MNILNQTIYTEEVYQLEPLPTVLLTKPWTNVTDSETKLLEKILTALKLSFDKVTIKHQESFDLSIWQVKPHRLIYFGLVPAGIPYYQVIDVNGVSLVASESLENLLTNDPARKQLWGALKQLFSS